MSNAILVLYAAVLVVNGQFLAGKVDAKSVWPVNIIVGVIAVISALFIGLTASQGDASAFVATLLLLFAVVFIMMGLNLLMDLDGKSLGYYCLYGVPVCVAWSYIFFTSVGSQTFGIFCLIWAGLFGLFAGILAFQKDSWAGFTSKYCFFCAFATLLIPASLSFYGVALP